MAAVAVVPQASTCRVSLVHGGGLQFVVGGLCETHAVQQQEGPFLPSLFELLPAAAQEKAATGAPGAHEVSCMAAAATLWLLGIVLGVQHCCAQHASMHADGCQMMLC